MKSKYTTHYSFLLVVLVHFGLLAIILLSPKSEPPLIIEPPTIQGVIVAVAPIEKPPEPVPTPPPPEQKPVPKPKIPLPKAPPSERAVKQEAVPEPAPPAPPAPVQDKPVPQQTSVTPPRVDASQSNNPAPVFPAASRRLREEGTALLEVLVKADGSIGELRLKKTSGYDRLDEAALRAVKQWHFSPAKRGDEAIDYWYELPIEFSLNN